jgi:hypothetical protein
MSHKTIDRQIAIMILLAIVTVGCGSFQNKTAVTVAPIITETALISPTNTAIPTITPPQSTPTSTLTKYAFPASIDPAKEYLFYLHGKIIEDQGLPAISPDYGEYEYLAILDRLSSYGFVVISEPRSKDTDSWAYAQKITREVKALVNAGVPAKNLTIVGASKGGGIAILVSNSLQNKDVHYVIMAICDPATVKDLIQNNVSLSGNVLSIYDYKDELAGSCQDLFAFSEGKGLSQHNEIVLKVGTGHGVLYKPLAEWITLIIQWVKKP